MRRRDIEGMSSMRSTAFTRILGALAGVTALALTAGSVAPAAGADSTTPGAAGTSPAASAPGSTAGSAPGASPSVLDPGAYTDLPSCDPGAIGDGPVEITVWHSMKADLLAKTIADLTNQYNASQSKVKVNAVNQGAYEETIAKYADASEARRPDVVQVPEYTVQAMIDLKTAVPVGSCMVAAKTDTSVFAPATLAQYAVNGVQWAMPFNVSDPVLIYNRKMFIAAGLDPDKPPTTLDELSAAARKIVESKAAPHGIAVDSNFDNGGGWFLEQWTAKLGQFYVDHDNGRAGRATATTFNTPEFNAAITQLQSMVKDGSAVDVGDNPSGFDHLLKLADKTAPAAMTITTSASIGAVLDVLKTGQFPHLLPEDVGVGPMPGPGAPGTIVGGAAMWINNSGDPQRIAAAWDYINYLTQAAQQSTWAAATGYIPIRADANELEPLKSKLADPRFAVAGAQLLAIPNTPTSNGPVVGPLQEVRTTLAQAIAKIYGGADVTATLAEAQAEMDRLIKDYNERNP